MRLGFSHLFCVLSPSRLYEYGLINHTTRVSASVVIIIRSFNIGLRTPERRRKPPTTRLTERLETSLDSFSIGQRRGLQVGIDGG